MRLKLTSALIGATIAGIFLYFVLQPGAFNVYPYLIYKALFERVNSEGEIVSLISEEFVIITFDVMISILVFWIAFKISGVLLRGKVQ